MGYVIKKMHFKFNLHATFKVELEKGIGNLSTTLSAEYKHLPSSNSHRKVATCRRAFTFLFYFFPLMSFTLDMNQL